MYSHLSASTYDTLQTMIYERALTSGVVLSKSLNYYSIKKTEELFGLKNLKKVHKGTFSCRVKGCQFKLYFSWVRETEIYKVLSEYNGHNHVLSDNLHCLDGKVHVRFQEQLTKEEKEILWLLQNVHLPMPKIKTLLELF